jgi:formate hydrogenlyase subunit 3/multisubunit Na+/H+ antiporter MnhD subunit
MDHEKDHQTHGLHWFIFNVMVLSMLLVVTAANTVLFLSAWEIMTISSFFLVAWHHQHEDVRKAAWTYLLAAHLGMMLLLGLFLLASSYCNSLDFADFKQLDQLATGKASLLFLLALFGFGVKAGLFPLHIWLPNAHPAAPSHVSALMSGVLIKTGIYGILRVLTWLPPAPQWWGWLVAVLGVAGALYGISLATQQSDIKRSLAYSTVENIGIIFLALGFGLVAVAQGLQTVAMFAFAGGLLHLWNHALFKGVMFLGAGALLHATGTRDMNRMGGLLRRMPITGALWIGGSLAIGALPPLNGLVSEWLIYVSLASAGAGQSGYLALLPLLLFGLLGLVGALALVTFSRLAGVCLLGSPRDLSAAEAHEVAPAMWLSMAALFTGCLAIGIYPQSALALLAEPLKYLLHAPQEHLLLSQVAPLGNSALLILAGLLLLAIFVALLHRRRPSAKVETWGCGYQFPSSRMAYTGGGYAELVARHVLPRVMRPTIAKEKGAGLFADTAKISLMANDIVLTRVLVPLFSGLAKHCQRLRWLQQGRLPVYLLYIVVTSALLMAWSMWAGGHGGG